MSTLDVNNLEVDILTVGNLAIDISTYHPGDQGCQMANQKA
jgi:hypothetical protein